MKNSKFKITTVLFLLLVIAVIPITLTALFHRTQLEQYAAGNSNLYQYTSVDTMKESRDTETHQITPLAIVDDVNLSASLNTTHITVATNWEYDTYIQEWIAAIRAAGKKVWFRGAPNQWENLNGATGIMKPSAYLTAEKNFILNHPSFFQSGDIFDPCPEPEQGHYWAATYGNSWDYPYPNTATKEYNKFIRDSKDVADTSFYQLGINGVITNVHSTNSWFATNPGALENATVSKMGVITVDSYPDNNTTDPQTAANERVNELKHIENAFHVPIIIGEIGYSTTTFVDGATQEKVLKAELNAISSLSFIIGMNYWVGAGSPQYDSTRIFTGSSGNWAWRPAAADLASFYLTKLGGLTPAPTNQATPTSKTINQPSQTPTPTSSPTRTVLST